MKIYSRIAMVATLTVGGAALAGATTFSFQTFGSTWSSVGLVYTVNEAMPPATSFNLQGNVTNVTALNYTMTAAPTSVLGGNVTGSGSFTDTTLGVVAFNFSGTYSTTAVANGIAVSDAATTYTLPSGGTLHGNFSDDLFQIGAQGVVVNYEYNTLNAVPEPASWAVMGLGALGLLARRRRR